MYTRKQLVSFGDFLLSKYGVMIHSTDGNNTPISQRQVGHWDLENWKAVTPASITDTLNYGDACWVCFNADCITGRMNATVVAVHDYGGQNKYDLELELDPDVRGRKTTRIYNVAEAFVYAITGETGPQSEPRHFITRLKVEILKRLKASPLAKRAMAHHDPNQSYTDAEAEFFQTLGDIDLSYLQTGKRNSNEKDN